MAQRNENDLTGRRVGEYEITARLGAGGMGIVYEGVQPLIGKRVAIKVLLPHLTQDPELVERFLAEARAVNAIRHRGIVDIFSFGELEEGSQYFVMEFLEGIAFDQILKKRGAQPAYDALSWTLEVLDALDAAHAAGVIHRDIKPSNLYLVDAGRGQTYVKLLDFGIAKIGAMRGQATPQTRVDAIIGTPDYMAPEQVRGEAISAKTDVYAMGCVLFELLTGRRPFRGENSMQTMFQHLEQPPPLLSSLVQGLPEELDDLIHWAMQKNPADRPLSAGEFRLHVEGVRRLIPHEPTRALPLPPSRQSGSMTPAPSRTSTKSGRMPLLDNTLVPQPAVATPNTSNSSLSLAPLAAPTLAAPRTRLEPTPKTRIARVPANEPPTDPPEQEEYVPEPTRITGTPSLMDADEPMPVVTDMRPAPSLTTTPAVKAPAIGGAWKVVALFAGLAVVGAGIGIFLVHSEKDVVVVPPPPEQLALRPEPEVEKKEPVVPGKPDPAVTDPPEPVVTGKKDPVVPGKADPVVPGKADPVVPGKADPVVPGKTDPVVTGKKDPVVAVKPDPQPKKVDPVGEKKDPVAKPPKEKGPSDADIAARLGKLETRLVAKEAKTGGRDRVLRQFLDQAKDGAKTAKTSKDRAELWSLMNDLQRQLDSP